MIIIGIVAIVIVVGVFVFFNLRTEPTELTEEVVGEYDEIVNKYIQ